MLGNKISSKLNIDHIELRKLTINFQYFNLVTNLRDETMYNFNDILIKLCVHV
jgi:hypothetical protein